MSNTALVIQQSGVHYPEPDTVNDLIKDCDRVMVTYGLDKDMKVTKIVTFYNAKFGFDNIGAGHNEAIRENSGVSLFKSFMYRLKNRNIVKSGIDFWAVLLKDIPGFTFRKDADIHDCRKY